MTSEIAAAETHIRIALEKGNLGDFAKCIAPLCELYYQADKCGDGAHAWSENVCEFMAYRILHGMIEERDYLINTSSSMCHLTARQR